MLVVEYIAEIKSVAVAYIVSVDHPRGHQQWTSAPKGGVHLKSQCGQRRRVIDDADIHKK